MFDIAPTELMLVAAVALVVIGPKDLPRAMRFVGYWVGKARSVARQFRSGFDTMVREAELEEMEKKWAAENARIMREHPPEIQPTLPPPVDDEAIVEGATPLHGAPADMSAETVSEPVMVEKPVVEPAPAATVASLPQVAPDKTPS